MERTASDLTPRSTPTTESGRAGAGSWRVISTENEQNHRPPRCDTVADRIRALPCSTCRASFRVDSCVRTRGDAGQLDVPAVGVGQAERAGGEPARQPCRLPLNFGNRTFGPRRVPFFDAFQLPSAVARLARPDEYASLEFSAHHGAMAFFVWFHDVRRL